MAKYLDKSQWEDQILIPDEQTPILGGQPDWDSTQMLSGWSNVPAGMLANRTRFLHDRIQEIEQDIEQGATGSLKIDNNLSDLQDVGQAKFNLELSLVDNVRDADKPVSAPQQASLNLKLNADANAVSASKLVTPRTISLSGDASGSTSFDGSANATIVVEVVDDSHNHVISNVDGLQTALDGKVDKVTGKQLSTNDYTTPEKNKLAGIESGAQVNVATNLGVGTRTSTDVVVTSSTGGEATLPVATTDLAGTISAADKTKLDGIAAGATANATNAQLRDRATHTGLQAISTVTGLQSALDAKIAAAGGVVSGLTLNDGYTEEVFAVTGTAPALSPTNGSIQTWVLSGNSTPTAGTWASGQSMTLMVDDGSAYTINWASMSIAWKTGGGTAPTLLTNGYTVIELVKVGSTIYGWLAGDA